MSAPSPTRQLEVKDQRRVDLTAERYGCGAHSDSERRACALFLWLLGPTTEQLSVSCPCQQPPDLRTN